MMESLNQDSLFSLELVVERLSLLKTVTCRFPAVAFRLLDFPTLLIHHVDHRLADNIRARTSADLYSKLPVQLPELSDRDGGFRVDKGKSCLFKVSPTMLQTHLSNAPLYVMILDTYPEVPKLVGSCSVPMNAVMDELYESIQQLGVSVPSVSGEKGEYDVYNLMGTKLGNIRMGYRLLSLGMALLPHIPDNQIAKLGTYGTKKVIDDDILQEADKNWENVNSVVSNKRETVQHEDTSHPIQKLFADMETQVHSHAVGTIGTQTVKKKRQVQENKGRSIQSKLASENDEVFITNIDCPPPLYYNSNAEPSAGNYCKHWKSYELRKQIFESDEDSSDKETIREEDKLSDIDFDEPRHPSDQLIAFKTKQNTIERLFLDKHQQRHTTANNFQANPVADISRFPILGALMLEIMKLQGFVPKPNAAAAGETVRTPRPKSDSMTTSPEPKTKFIRSPDRMEHSHRRCASPPPQVPKKQSWLRNKPLVTGVPSQCDLQPGLTKTVMLRLTKTNPVLMKQLVAKEDKRRDERRCRLQATKNGNRNNIANLTVEIDDDVKLQRDVAGYTQHLADGLQESQLTGRDTARRRPVPTPRSSIIGINNQRIERRYVEQRPDHFLEQTIEEKEDPSRLIADDLPVHNKLQAFVKPANSNKKYITVDGVKNRVGSDIPGPSTIKGVMVHVPSLPVHDDSGSEDDKIETRERRLSLSRTITLLKPALSNSSFRSTSEHVVTYSEDFEDSVVGGDQTVGRREGANFSDDESGNEPIDPTAETQGLEPELRKIVDNYSNDDSDGEENHQNEDSPLVLEPLLKKIIDRYSDDESDGKEEDHCDTLESTAGKGEPTTPKLHESEDVDSSVSPEPVNYSGSPGPADYSEAFDDVLSDNKAIPEVKMVKDARLAPEARFGYTWAGK